MEVLEVRLAVLYAFRKPATIASCHSRIVGEKTILRQFGGDHNYKVPFGNLAG